MHYFSYFSQNIDCGYSLELPRLIEAVLTSTHNLCFEEKYEKYRDFLSENFHIFLNRRVFVMTHYIFMVPVSAKDAI